MNEEKLNLFRDYLNSRSYSDTTVRNYLNVIRQFRKWNHANIPLSKELLFRYLEQMRSGGMSYSYIRITVLAVGLYAEVIHNISIKHDFLRGFRRHAKLPDVLSVEEVKLLLESINNIKHKAIMSVIYSCGLRISECINLKLSDVDSHKMLIKIAHTKDKKARFVPLSPKLLELLKDYKQEYMPEIYLFEGQTEEKYSVRSIQTVLKTALKHSNIKKKISVQSLRHSFATHLVEQGTDLSLIQSLLGHRDIRSTQVYIHIATSNHPQFKNPFDGM